MVRAKRKLDNGQEVAGRTGEPEFWFSTFAERR
jgi:hypothetical protein